MRVAPRPDFRRRDPEGLVHPGLSAPNEYYVIALSDRHYRLIDNDGCACLYPTELFTLVDDTIPADWVKVDHGDGFQWSPAELAQPGFFEDVFEAGGALDPLGRAATDLIAYLRDAALSSGDSRDRAILERDIPLLERRINKRIERLRGAPRT